MVIFDLTPFIVLGVLFGMCVIYLLFEIILIWFYYTVHVPRKHKKTGLRLYRFGKTVYGDVTEARWFSNDEEAVKFQRSRDYYDFRTVELYPNQRYLKE
jgi:hypothetical protein